jgi:hypothetical protein
VNSGPLPQGQVHRRTPGFQLLDGTDHLFFGGLGLPLCPLYTELSK